MKSNEFLNALSKIVTVQLVVNFLVAKILEGIIYKIINPKLSEFFDLDSYGYGNYRDLIINVVLLIVLLVISFFNN